MFKNTLINKKSFKAARFCKGRGKFYLKKHPTPAVFKIWAFKKLLWIITRPEREKVSSFFGRSRRSHRFGPVQEGSSDFGSV